MSYSDKDPIVWVEKYRPKTIDDCILPAKIKNVFQRYVKKNDFPDLLLVSSAGTGKTTIARALCEELGCDTILINASDERNLDVVRNTIRNFASQTSLKGNQKAIILDEADGLSRDYAQPALRAAMEEFSDVRFILTCNYENKLISPIRSRSSTIYFNTKKAERGDVALQFLKRVFSILDTEKVTFDKKVVAAVIKKYYPDNRRILNELQAYSGGEGGTIDSGMLSILDKSNIGNLLDICKDKDFAKARVWIADNALETDQVVLFRGIYDTFYDKVAPESLPELIFTIRQYMVDSSTAVDPEINILGLVMYMMTSVEYK